MISPFIRKELFPLKPYVFIKNIVLHNIIGETKRIAIRTQFYRLFCEKITQKNEMRSLLTSALNTDSTVSGLHFSIGRKGHSLQGYTGWMTERHWKIDGLKRPVSVLYVSFAQNGRKVHFILLWIRIEFIFQCYKSSVSIICWCQPF